MIARQRMEGLVAAWLPPLGLSHWKVTVDWTRAPEDVEADAEIEKDTPYDVARIRFATTFDQWTREYAEVVVVHELLHLLTRDMEEAVAAAVAAMPKSSRPLAEGWVNHEVEGVIDRLAFTLVVLAAGRIAHEGFTC